MPCVIEKTVFTFAELSDKAKERARDKYREYGMDYEWWGSTYEDAVLCAAKLGIGIETRSVKLIGGGTRRDPSIWFSGFSNQGDGASYEGHYNPTPNAVKSIVEHAPQDDELKAIAEGLTLLQITSRLHSKSQLCAQITVNGRYSHSGTMNVAVSPVESVEDFQFHGDAEEALTALLRRFADWIYAQLEAEDEYLNSDECIDELLADNEFDEDGTVI